MKRLEYVAALRELADYVETHEFPDTRKNMWGDKDIDVFDAPRLMFYTDDKVRFGEICAVMGSFEKLRSEYSTGAKATLPSGAYVEVSASRSVVCTRRVVGTKTIPAQEERIEATPEQEVEIVEWECPESFIALAKETENVG